MDLAPELPLRERLGHWVEHLEQVLPAQAPIRQFVHHNTLHGFQHLPFTEALAAAQRLTGARAYLDEAEFRACHAAGRITVDDLAAALDEAGQERLDEFVVRGLTRREVLLASLLTPPEQAVASRLAWEGRERNVADGGLWQACVEVLPAAAGAALGKGDEAWRREALEQWSGLLQRVGRDWSLRSLLEHLTGEDVLENARGVLQRHLAAHLDLGQAAWRNPAREKGFYAAWRASAAVDFCWELDELPNVRDEIACLPEDALDALMQELSTLVADEEQWFAVVERLALEMPGWSGMVLWRDGHPERGDGTPVSMLDYLAVRVLLERLLTEDLIRRLTGAAMSPAELAGYFAAEPAEFFVRHALRTLPLAEDLAHRAAALVSGSEGGSVDERAWLDLARAIAAGKAAANDGTGRVRWFCQLAERLGLDAGDLRHCGEEGAAALQAEAVSLDSLQRGHVWLLAYERHYRQEIFAALTVNHGRCPDPARPSAQVVFCMDDREEGIRRHLEEIAPGIDTFGAAGFFGVPMWWQGIDDDEASALCPVVVRPQHSVRETARAEAAAVAAQHAGRRDRRLAWRERFLQGTRRNVLTAPLLTAAAAPVALAALAAVTAAPGWFGETLERWRQQFDGRVPTRLDLNAAPDSPPGTPEAPRAGFSDDEQADRVETFLRMIGLVGNFAPLVVMLGHGSGSRNNPHMSAYDCGACSGSHGGPNGRVFAAMANRPQVRAILAGRGLPIPVATRFVAGERNTCDDGIEWYDSELLPASHQAAFDLFVGQMNEAARAHAAERCRRFASAPAGLSPWQGRQHVVARRHDVSQARPELGHATNAAAFIGRRSMSRGLFLDRRVFLISYDPTRDADGAIVEGILLAAGPVGAGIALEYYFSTVDNERYGCGSKITHNLAGLFGVMEGADSDLRTGLPRQMIEIHEAMRLLVVVEQAPDLLSAIVARQPALQELVGNAWISLAAKDPDSGAIHRYRPRRGWLPWQGPAVLPRVARSVDWFGGEREALAPAILLGAPR